MVKPRRAKARPLRLVPSLAVALALIGGIIYAAIAYGPRGTSAGPDIGPSVAATESRAAPSPTRRPPPAVSNEGDAAAAGLALRQCRAKVAAADEVLAAAKTGVAHWATHVRAQTDANASRITVDRMNRLFKATRLAGPADQRRYAAALAGYKKRSGSCAQVDGAGERTAASLKRCNQRADAQRPVLAAAADGMADWKNHLAAMQRNAEDHVGGAQRIWLRAWRAAPPNIKAYREAAADFDAPRC